MSKRREAVEIVAGILALFALGTALVWVAGFDWVTYLGER
jgi:hypothetical protein